MGKEITQKPWSRKKLDLHVMQCIREYVDAALVLYRSDDDDLEGHVARGWRGRCVALNPEGH
jgi:hypothetical protein